VQQGRPVHCKKKLTIFPSPAGMSLTKLSLAGTRECLVSDIPAGDGKITNLFVQCTWAVEPDDIGTKLG
jgi:hypothetical protein